jgi:hypothetical protein
MTALLVGYARVSTDAQDLTAQRDALDGLGVAAERTYVDHGLTGTSRDRPGLRTALAVCRDGDTLIVTSSTGLPAHCPMTRLIVRRQATSVWLLVGARPRARGLGPRQVSTGW